MESPKGHPLSFFFTFTPFGDFIKFHDFHCHHPYVDDFQISTSTHTHTQECVEFRGLTFYIFSLISILIYPSIYSSFPFWCLRGILRGFPGGTSGENPPCQLRRHRRHKCNSWGRKIPWRRAQKPIPVFFLENATDRGAWRTVVNRVAKSQTWLKQLSMHAYILRSKTKLLIFTRRRQWHPTPVLLPGKSHGRRSLVGYSPWGL